VCGKVHRETGIAISTPRGEQEVATNPQRDGEGNCSIRVKCENIEFLREIIL